MSDLIPITVNIADRTYRIKIPAQQEASVRKVIKTINDKVVEYRTQFAGKDMQDYVSMVLLWLATEKENAITPSDVDSITHQLEALDNIIVQALKNNV